MADPHLLPSRCSAPLGLSDPVTRTCSPLTPHPFPHAQEPNPNPRSCPATPRRRRRFQPLQLQLRPPSAPPRRPLPSHRRNRAGDPSAAVAARPSSAPAAAHRAQSRPPSTSPHPAVELVELLVSHSPSCALSLSFSPSRAPFRRNARRTRRRSPSWPLLRRQMDGGAATPWLTVVPRVQCALLRTLGATPWPSACTTPACSPRALPPSPCSNSLTGNSRGSTA